MADWSAIGTVGSAVFAAVAAGLTWKIAVHTAAQASASESAAVAAAETAALTREEQKERSRPLVVASINGLETSGYDVNPRVLLANAGGGPATNIEINVWYEDHPAGFDATARWPYLGPGERAEFVTPGRMSSVPQAGLRQAGFRIRGTCTDRTQTSEEPISFIAP
jgi:hypothetical protein